MRTFEFFPIFRTSLFLEMSIVFYLWDEEKIWLTWCILAGFPVWLLSHLMISCLHVWFQAIAMLEEIFLKKVPVLMPTPTIFNLDLIEASCHWYSGVRKWYVSDLRIIFAPRLVLLTYNAPLIFPSKFHYYTFQPNFFWLCSFKIWGSWDCAT